MMKVRTNPAAPTIEPAIIKTLLLMTNPVKAAATPEREFSRLTTTGISAPPIGSTKRIPSKQLEPTSAQTQSVFSGSLTVITTKANEAIKRPTLTKFSHGGPQVGKRTHFLVRGIVKPPFNLNMATKEPVRVIHPTRPESPIAIQIAQRLSISVGTSPVLILAKTSDSATNALAAPPKPLNIATNSGIPVISTLTAIQAPMTEPRTRPPTNSSQPIIPFPDACILTRVVITAKSIPAEPS